MIRLQAKSAFFMPSMEGLIPLVENGRFFDASMIRCRIDLLTY